MRIEMKRNYYFINLLLLVLLLVFIIIIFIIIKNNTQTAVINIINLRIIYKLDVSYASQHTFSKVTVTIF